MKKYFLKLGKEIKFRIFKSDLERFKDLYESVGIELRIENEPHQNDGNLMLKIKKSLHNGFTEKIGGYTGHYSEIVFNKKGKFIKQNFYE